MLLNDVTNLKASFGFLMHALTYSSLPILVSLLLLMILRSVWKQMANTKRFFCVWCFSVYFPLYIWKNKRKIGTNYCDCRTKYDLFLWTNMKCHLCLKHSINLKNVMEFQTTKQNAQASQIPKKKRLAKRLVSFESFKLMAEFSLINWISVMLKIRFRFSWHCRICSTLKHNW